MKTCDNCGHPVGIHTAKGCWTGAQAGDPCPCPFDYDKAGEVDVQYEDAKPSAMDTQVGGDHYRQTGIQPWEIWKAYGLDPWQASVIKYILRAGRKENVPAVQDYEKAKHCLEYLIEREGE